MKILLVVLIVETLAYTVPPPKFTEDRPTGEREPIILGVCDAETPCPEVNCVRAPCPWYICAENKCVLKHPDDVCVRSGCSGQLCVSINEDVISTCEWKEEYTCFNENGVCEFDNEAKRCGWRQSAELLNCLSEKSIPEP